MKESIPDPHTLAVENSELRRLLAEERKSNTHKDLKIASQAQEIQALKELFHRRRVAVNEFVEVRQ